MTCMKWESTVFPLFTEQELRYRQIKLKALKIFRCLNISVDLSPTNLAKGSQEVCGGTRNLIVTQLSIQSFLSLSFFYKFDVICSVISFPGFAPTFVFKLVVFFSPLLVSSSFLLMVWFCTIDVSFAIYFNGGRIKLISLYL